MNSSQYPIHKKEDFPRTFTRLDMLWERYPKYHEKTVHYLAVFDKEDMNTCLLMYHLLYTNGTDKVFGGYSLYDYTLPWYQNHLRQDGVVLRSPYLPDKLAKFQGHLPFYHNPAKTVYVRRNVEHILECGYFSTELEFFRQLTDVLMPHCEWWYRDLALYEEKDVKEDL